jgi:hypothetical protein
MSIYSGGNMLCVREALQLINSRPGWRVSKSRFYAMMESGTVPARIIEVNVNSRYLLSKRELEQWIDAYEARHRDGGTG